MGTGVALVTPFKEDFSIDTMALTNIVKHCIDGGVDYLVALGTTAETATLTEVEKQLAIDTIISANAGRLPLVLGIGGNNTSVVVDTYNVVTWIVLTPYSPYPPIITNLPKRVYTNILRQLRKIHHCH